MRDEVSTMGEFDPDPQKLEAIVERLRQHVAESDGAIAFTLEEFFDGNNDMGSLLCNISEHPGMATLYEAFVTLRNQPGVGDVRVVVRELEAEDTWPFSDTVAVHTTAAPEEIARRVRELLPEAAAPDDVFDDPDEPPPAGLVAPASGERIVRL